jgi:predicted alpha-1,2-mannosidase
MPHRTRRTISKPHRRPSGTGRIAALVVVTAASTLAFSGFAAASTTPTPTPSATPTPAASAAGTTTALGQAKGKTTCRVTRDGHLADCQKPVAKNKIPAGAQNASIVGQAPTDLASLVDTRTWTTGGGNTFPGADVPFGMVQWSPDTDPNRNAGGGYGFTDTTLEGYSLTHISGPGCGAAGDVPILPVTSAPASGTDPNSMTTTFSHTNEVAQAGYYSAQSNSPSTITSEFTETTHSAMGRFTFPSSTTSGFDIKLADSQTNDTNMSATIVGNDEVQGSVTTGNFCGTNEGQQSQNYTVYFDIVFNRPFTSSQIITNSGQTDPAAVFVSFDTTSNPVVEAKVGISYVSAANAQLDWQTENPGWDFATVKAAAHQSWNQLLGKVNVSGGSYSQTQEFYSLLYKDFIQPNVTSDVNGQFMGADFKVHSISGGQQNQYGIYSGWDIYHSLAQLQAMLDPSAASDQAQSQLNYYAEDSLLQQWGYLNLNNYVMVGDPAQAIIAGYYAFGAHNFDTKTALADMLKEATTVNDVRPGEALEAQYGYLPEDGSYGCCNFHGVVASLLEDDNADLALSNFAQSLGDSSDAAMLQRRANNWENMFNPNNNLLNARYLNGQFEPGIAPLTQQNGEPDYVEGDAYEYLWDVPNDYQTLFALLGGVSAADTALTTYLSQPNGYGMYDQVSNEFTLGEQYAQYYAGDPAGALAAVNNIRNTVYMPGPSGLANNDDLGAESSQFIWEMLGMYPENPGTGTLLLNSPGFPSAQIDLPSGKTITVNAPGASPSEYYVSNLKINGSPYKDTYTTYSDLASGATLDWTLSTTPTDWGTSPNDAPPSYTAGIKPTVGYTTNDTATVAPGKSTTVTVGAANATHQPQKVDVSLTAPSGVTVTPATATIVVPPDGRGTVKLTVSAAASTTQNFYAVPIKLTTEGSGATQSLNQTVLVATPGSLLSTYNNAGISADSNPSDGNFDGGGYSYSANALAAAGFTAGQNATVNGVTFPWPISAPGFPDNTVPDGQKVTVDAAAGTQTLGFLGSATNGGATGVVTLNYSDGSSQKYWLGLSDWTLGGGNGSAGYGNQIAASTSYRNCPGCKGGQQSVKTYVFYAAVPVNAGKTLTSVTLPSGTMGGAEHLFSIGTSTAAMTGPVINSLSATSASAGTQVTINGSGFGATQGSSYVAFGDNGTNWGAPGNAATFTVTSWSDTAITFTVPQPSGTNGQYKVWAGTPAALMVTDNSGNVSDTAEMDITPTSNLADYYDNAGITDDTNTSCTQYDGVGYSYSAQALAAAGLTPGGTVSADGLTFTWPNVASCAPDNILTAGQTLLVNGAAGASKLGLLESSTDGSTSGMITINYTDGTSTTQTVSSSDWAGGPGPGETAVATMPYRNMVSGGSQALTMYVYATTVPVDSAKTVASITFPNVSNTIAGGATAMHIFAVTTG